MEIEYLTELHTKPVPRDYPAKHLKKNTNKKMLTQDFIIKVLTDDKGTVGSTHPKEIVICVPKGYVTDFASIPRVFHRLYHPFETESAWGSVVHDYVYSHLYYKFSKEFADILLKNMIEKDGGSWFMQQAFYRSVRLNYFGGGWHDG